MNSERLLLDLYKKQHYDESRHKMQKIIITTSAVANAIGILLMIAFHPGIIYTVVFTAATILACAALLLSWAKIISLNIASFIYMSFFGFVLMPVFWYLTGIFGSAPYVSLVFLVSILSMFSGKMLKGILSAYLGLILVLVVYSVVTELPLAEDLPSLFYTVVAYTFAIIMITTYIISKLKRFEQLNDQFLRSSFKDELTRTYNRKLLDIILEFEEDLFVREKCDYILVMLDVDNFKKMNDTKGHIFGDIILRNLAKCITDEVREEDFVVRYGGDEFLVVQTKSSEASLHALTERLDAAIEASCYMDVEISISYGFAARAIGMHNADGGAGACGQAAV